MLNIHHIENESYIYGVGKRFVIWFQGCALRCQGCWNESMWSFENNQLFSTNMIIDKIIKIKELEGVTILGGEPMHQADELLVLVKAIKKLNLTVILYTGFEKGELKKNSEIKLTEISDVVIFGRYIESLRDVFLKMRGSRNQTILINNKNYQEHFIEEANEVEININEDGSIIVYGYPTEELLEVVGDER